MKEYEQELFLFDDKFFFMKGFSPHISPFVEPPDVGSLLQRTGFSIVTLVREIE